ncbi:MAG TPA: DHA2 family efflux MFS transporter permease subunit [Pseudonocardia sp.]|nr:DHA2 family efflux MFS transporter permease subunit [Pseudonocardia sp.]
MPPSVSTGPGTTGPGRAGGTGAEQGWAIPLLVLIAGMFMSVLDISIVNVAIPTIQNDYGVTTEEVQWIATAYSLALGVIVPISGWLSDKFGPSRAYIVSLVGFAAGSALCGLAWNLESMIVFRILQAIPGGILPVVTLTIVYRIVPREKIGAAMGMYGLGIVVAPAVGPTLGGYLVEYVDWRLIFFINVPVGVVGAVAAVMLLPRFAGGRAGRFDVLGFLTIATGLFSLLLALSEGQDWGWTSYRVLILLTLGVLSLALFVIIELEVDRPLLDVRVFRYWAFTNSLLLISVLSVGLFGVLFYIPLFLQQAQGMGAFEAGLVLLPQALVMGVLMPVAGRLYDRIGPRWPAVIGLTIVAIGTYELHYTTVDMTHEHMMWLLVFRASGMGLAMMPIMTGGISAIPPAQVSSASAFNNVVQRTTAALGLAILTAILTSQQAQFLADRSALIPSATPLPDLGASADSGLVGALAVYQQTQNQVFVSGLNDLYVITAALTAVGVVLALMLRSGPVPTPAGGPASTPSEGAAPASPKPPASEPAPSAPIPQPHDRARAAEPVPVLAGAGSGPTDELRSNGPGRTDEPVITAEPRPGSRRC